MTDADNQFLQYEPLLWRVQARLVRDGYLIEPQDARDFIHDFYLEWDRLLQRYRPGTGAFEPYLVTAFYRFCRRRVFKLEKLRSQTAELEEAAELPEDRLLVSDALALQQQMAQLENLIAALPDEARALLGEFLDGPAGGERALAKKYGLSRYRLRERLAEVVARIALQMTEAPYDSLDAKLARGVWLEGRTARSVAAGYGVTVAELQAARQRFSQALLSAARAAGRPSTTRRKNMDILQLFKRAVLAHDETSMAQLRQQSRQVREALDADQAPDFTDEELARLYDNPESLATVYQFLGNASAADEVIAAAFHAERDAQSAVGQAWETLADRLDLEWPQWEYALRELEIGDGTLREHFSATGADSSSARRLLRYGLTPAMLYEAWDNIHLLFNRAARRPAARREAGSCVLVRGLDGIGVNVSLARIQRQVASTRDLELKPDGRRAAILTDWTFRLLATHPFLIDGYEYDDADGTFQQLPDYAVTRPLSFDALAGRWCRQASGVARGHKAGFIAAGRYSSSQV